MFPKLDWGGDGLATLSDRAEEAGHRGGVGACGHGVATLSALSSDNSDQWQLGQTVSISRGLSWIWMDHSIHNGGHNLGTLSDGYAWPDIVARPVALLPLWQPCQPPCAHLKSGVQHLELFVDNNL